MEEKGEIPLPWAGSSWAGEGDGAAGRARAAVTLSDTLTCASSIFSRKGLLKGASGPQRKSRLNTPHSHLSLSEVTRAEVGCSDQGPLQAGVRGKNGWLIQTQP